jgi:pimeloyl-ACP methyl ester carboxylesterase
VSSSRALLVAFVIALGVQGCARRAPAPAGVASAEPGRVAAGGTDAGAPLAPALEAPAALPLRVERIRVPGDLPAVVVNDRGGEPPRIVFLPGICSNVLGYVQAFQGAAHAHGGVVGLDGDAPCGDAKDYRSFSWDAGKLHGRIEAALAAAGRTEIPREGIVLVGYSQGAALGEQLVARHPGRYARVVLIGAPTEPSAASFARARAVATMSCQRDVPAKMKEATVRIARTKVPSAYFEMPGCTHGMMSDGERVFEETFSWLEGNARPVAADAKATSITGALEGT